MSEPLAFAPQLSAKSWQDAGRVCRFEDQVTDHDHPARQGGTCFDGQRLALEGRSSTTAAGTYRPELATRRASW